mmetsp:Transcript_86173/g.248847  ORF Transcript_86173/g.248847 Transcript_86173/m.248847 type:complete len:217 (-) Transcript_86173:459-1109(-)
MTNVIRRRKQRRKRSGIRSTKRRAAGGIEIENTVTRMIAPKKVENTAIVTVAAVAEVEVPILGRVKGTNVAPVMIAFEVAVEETVVKNRDITIVDIALIVMSNTVDTIAVIETIATTPAIADLVGEIGAVAWKGTKSVTNHEDDRIMKIQIEDEIMMVEIIDIATMTSIVVPSQDGRDTRMTTIDDQKMTDVWSTNETTIMPSLRRKKATDSRVAR